MYLVYVQLRLYTFSIQQLSIGWVSSYIHWLSWVTIEYLSLLLGFERIWQLLLSDMPWTPRWLAWLLSWAHSERKLHAMSIPNSLGVEKGVIGDLWPASELQTVPMSFPFFPLSYCSVCTSLCYSNTQCKPCKIDLKLSYINGLWLPFLWPPSSAFFPVAAAAQNHWASERMERETLPLNLVWHLGLPWDLQSHSGFQLETIETSRSERKVGHCPGGCLCSCLSSLWGAHDYMRLQCIRLLMASCDM